MMGLARAFRWLGAAMPRLDWVQVEVTTRCNAACRYCPRVPWAGAWLGGDLDPALLNRLLPQLQKTTLVHLQGWGEPLLHPELVPMVEAAVRTGHRVATTTNGLLLHRAMQRSLVAAGLDLLGLSLVGVDRSNDVVRTGTSAARVLDAVASLAGMRERSSTGKPGIHIAYLLLKSGLDHLPEAVRTLGEAGADQVVVSSLDLVVDPSLLGETFWNLTPGESHRLLEVVRSAGEAAARAGTRLVVQLALQGSGGRCIENTGRSLYVGFDGAVLPCVMAAVPAAGRRTHWGPRGPAVQERVPLGNLHREDLAAVWARPAARRLRRALRGDGPPPPRCRDCFKAGVRTLGTAPPPHPGDLMGRLLGEGP